MPVYIPKRVTCRDNAVPPCIDLYYPIRNSGTTQVGTEAGTREGRGGEGEGALNSLRSQPALRAQGLSERKIPANSAKG